MKMIFIIPKSQVLKWTAKRRAVWSAHARAVERSFARYDHDDPLGGVYCGDGAALFAGLGVAALAPQRGLPSQ